MAENNRIDVGPDGNKRVVLSSSQKMVKNETSKAIRKIMESVEAYTNYNNLPESQKDIVRETVLNQVNKLSRVITHKQTMVFNK